MKRTYIILLLPVFVWWQVAQGEAIPPLALPLSTEQIATLREAQVEEITDGQLTWKGDPLSIALPLGKEKRVIFPEPLAVDINGQLTSDQLRIINNDQNLYLTAQTNFPKTRIYVTLKKSQQIILLDLFTTNSATPATQKIVLRDKKINPSVVQTKSPLTPEGKILSADAYVNAIRFSWQQLYAPSRLLTSDPGFTRTPMHSTFWTPELLYGDKVLAHPQASWQADGLFVTAVELRNKYPHLTTLSLSHDLCGDWQAATLYPYHHLKPAGDKSGDATTLFLISNKPFHQAMEICYGGA